MYQMFLVRFYLRDAIAYRSHCRGRGVAIKSGLGAEKNFLARPPQFRSFGGDLMTYHYTGQKTFKTQRKNFLEPTD